MSDHRRNAPIGEWLPGQTVSGFALLTRKERRQDRNGNDFLDMEIADASGRISAKVWGDSPALAGEFEAYEFVAFKGLVKSFRDQLQLTVHKCRRTTEADREHGFDESKLIPSTLEDLDDLERRLDRVLTRDLTDPALRALAAEAMRLHGKALREHPAAKSIHHAYRGGLLEHVVSMAELAVAVGRHYEELDLDLLVVGVLFHDLGKLIEIGAMPRNEYTDAGRLVGHVVIGRDLAREAARAVPELEPRRLLHLEHLILSHQGRLEYGSPVLPMTAEALALHFIDNLDSKLAQLRQAARGAEGFQYIKGLGRMVYLGEGSTTEEDEASGEDPGQHRLDL